MKYMKYIYVQNNVPLACYNINVVSESFFC